MSKSWHGGKGSKPRPVDRRKFNENFDRIFASKTRRCDVCKEAVYGRRAGDEVLDYCDSCERFVEGGTHTCNGEDNG